MGQAVPEFGVGCPGVGFGSTAAITALKRHAREAEMLEDMPEETAE
jgi:hypothetical protein